MEVLAERPQPESLTFSYFQLEVFTLIEELYEPVEFVGSNVLRQAATRLRILSQIFPELELTVEQVLSAED